MVRRYTVRKTKLSELSVNGKKFLYSVFDRKNNTTNWLYPLKKQAQLAAARLNKE